ncbi:hypothetical protein ACJJTC_005542 [Scirpophaga incertulas]
MRDNDLLPRGSRRNVTKITICVPSPIEWDEGASWARWVSLGSGTAGLGVAAAAAGALWRHRATPVVKSASRELCALQLCAAAACHTAALAAALRPAPLPCSAVRLAEPALAAVYAAVLARTVRVARLVAASAPGGGGGGRVRCLSSRAQPALWAALSAPAWAAAAWAALRWPPAPVLRHPGRARSVLACSGDEPIAQLVPLAPVLALLVASAALAIRTRRLPHNLNETKFVGAAAYATCVAWAAFAPLYAATEARTAALCACASLSAGAVVALSLGPRVWVCLCRPERNTRAHFLTATSIRCHLGKYRPDDAGAPSNFKQFRNSACQVNTVGEDSDQEQAACGAGGAGGEVCAAAGACARVTRTAAAGAAPDSNLADVLIVLWHHRHALPDV